MNATQEEWRPVFGWEGLYEVSEYGRVRSLDRIVHLASGTRRCRGRLLSLYIDENNYPRANLQSAGQRRLVRVHILVLEAFVSPRPEGFVGCHCDGDTRNNHFSNLRWDTYSGNNFDIVKHGNHLHATKTHCKNGHPFDAANTMRRTDNGGRRCRRCLNESMKRSRGRNEKKPQVSSRNHTPHRCGVSERN